VRRIVLLSVVLLAAYAARAPREHWRGLAETRLDAMRDGGAQEPRAPQPTQPPVFRGGTTLVQIDAIVTDNERLPIIDLTAADFELLDDGKAMTIDRVRFLGAEDYSGDRTLAPIRSLADEEREASRDDVRVYAIVLDDYHVPRMGELRVIEPLLAFVRQLPATDLVAVFYPLDSVTDVSFMRDREPVLQKIRKFYGRLGDYTPIHPVEEEHLRHPQQIEQIRRQIVATELQGLAIHLGAIKQGRKSVIVVSEAFSQPVSDVRDLYEAANRSNVAFYPLDPRGLTMDRSVDRGPTAAEIMAMVLPAREFMRVLAAETGGRAILGNDVRASLGQVIRDSRAYYLIAYESPHPDDGKFHKVTVRVRRPRAQVFARTGYWAFRRGENVTGASPASVSVPAPVQVAVDKLADSLRPDADEPAGGRRRIIMPGDEQKPTAPLLSAPTIAVVHGRVVGEPVSRREFRRTDIIVVRAEFRSSAAVAAGEQVTASISGRLLDRRGQPLTELPVTGAAAGSEVRLPLGNLGPGDYVIELNAKSNDETVQQFVAFRVIR
jgi:VWFA-related protein